LLADDGLGAGREDPLKCEAYASAFEAIEEDPNQSLLVARLGSSVVGLLQLTFIPGLTYTGGWRAQIEGVRVARRARGGGVGQALVQAAIDRASRRGCCLVQLTTDARRPEALAFYEGLGFQPSHVGLKLRLEDEA
jgi:ribosomal protein S18 acetylase RimI-like enzyme